MYQPSPGVVAGCRSVSEMKFMRIYDFRLSIYWARPPAAAVLPTLAGGWQPVFAGNDTFPATPRRFSSETLENRGLPSLAGALQGGMVVFMVKCAIIVSRAFLARFNAFLLVGVILPLCIRYQQVHQQPDNSERRGYHPGYFSYRLFHFLFLWLTFWWFYG